MRAVRTVLSPRTSPANKPGHCVRPLVRIPLGTQRTSPVNTPGHGARPLSRCTSLVTVHVPCHVKNKAPLLRVASTRLHWAPPDASPGQFRSAPIHSPTHHPSHRHLVPGWPGWSRWCHMPHPGGMRFLIIRIMVTNSNGCIFLILSFSVQ
jgi:hypothetical protein